MAKKSPRPGRRVILLLLVIAAMYGGIAANGVWKPGLGLDLQGGTRITLEATTQSGQTVTPEKLAEASRIIDQRVNASGVAEAEVGTQGDRNIVVEIPGQNRRDLVDAVKQTAQLRFRLVAGSAAGVPTPDPSASPSASPSGDAGVDPSPTPSPSATPRGRAPFTAEAPSPSASPSAEPTAPATPDAAASQPGAPIDQPLRWQDNPGQEYVQEFLDYTCPRPGQPAKQVDDNPDEPLVTCDDSGTKYLLSVAVIEGTQLTDASAGIPQNEVDYVVDLSFDRTARSTFADVTRRIAGTQKQFAIVLDGTVISAPQVISPILGGNAQITGDFSQEEADSLASSLRYGALPLKFTVPVISDEGPTLAADQLSAGIAAGAIGLLLVMLYCLLYYRGLGLVVIASLVVAGALTYAAVIFLSLTAGFTLTLPGIAGLIVAVGITADSFIVFFERIRDEMREGRSMRMAVEAGWVRARTTCLAADAVSLLAAVVLYIFAIGVVKGFAFALGISTLIDLGVFFLFTKPLVSYLGRFRFFNQGHKLSGLDAESLGVDPARKPGLARPTRTPTPTAGGRA